MRTATSTAVVEVSRMYRGSSKVVVESGLSRRPGVVGVDDNPVAQTATVTYDPAVTSVAEIAEWVRECGYRCEGCCVPQHMCDPMEEPSPHGAATPRGDVHPGHGTTPTTPQPRVEPAGGEQPRTAAPDDTAKVGLGDMIQRMSTTSTPARHRRTSWATVATAWGCRWTTWSATCATGSSSRPCSRCRSRCGRRSGEMS